MKPIRKAVFPVAGLGTRFLPATKAMPKEMLTVVDRPLIQHVVDEARAAGIEHFIFVTGRNKGVIEDHFDLQYELERDARRSAARRPNCRAGRGAACRRHDPFTRQQAPLGLGHAVWCARELVGNEPFAVLLPDVLIQAEPSCPRRWSTPTRSSAKLQTSRRRGSAEGADLVGTAWSASASARANRARITGMVEKPKPADAPSNLIITGRYILQPEIFDLLETQQSGAGGEIQLTDAMLRLLENAAGLRASSSRAAPSTAARSSGSCQPTSPTRSRATTSRKHFGRS